MLAFEEFVGAPEPLDPDGSSSGVFTAAGQAACASFTTGGTIEDAMGTVEFGWELFLARGLLTESETEEMREVMATLAMPISLAALVILCPSEYDRVTAEMEQVISERESG